MTKEEKLQKAKKIYEDLGFSVKEFEIQEIKDIVAELFLPKERQRGIGGVIIAEDGTYLICGSIYPISYCVEEFKQGKRN